MSNVPKLRFREFVGEWTRKRVDEVYSFKTTNSLSRDALNYQGGNVFNIHYGDIHTKFLTSFCLKHECVPYINSDLTLEKIKKDNYCEEGDLVIADASEDYADIGKAIELVDLDDAQVLAGLHTILARPKKNSFALGFAGRLFQSWSIRKQIMRLSQGAKVLGLSKGYLSEVLLDYPALVEQQKIAAFLTAVDTKIEQLTKKEGLLKQYKKGVIQKIFSQEIRFKADDGSDFPGWEEKTLGDLCKVARSGGTPAATNREYYHGGIPFLSISDMTTQGKYLRYTTKTLSQKGMDNSAAWLVPENTVIYSMYASVGFVSINKIPLATSQAVINLIFKENVDAEFIYYYLSDFGRHIHRFIETGTQGNLNAQIVKGFAIRVPSLVEQTKIANFLSSIDSKIDQVQKQLASVKSFKNGLLQQMFV